MSAASDTAADPGPETGSPCIRNCCLDERDVCLGCGRRLQEILAWHQATPAQRAAINERARRRLRRSP